MEKERKNRRSSWQGLLVVGLWLLCLQTTAQPVVWRQERQGNETRIRVALPLLKLKSPRGYTEGKVPVLEEGVSWAAAGEPDLPEVAYEIAVAGAEGAQLLEVDWEGEERLTGVSIAPAAAHHLVGQSPKARVRGAVYSQDVLFPKKRVELSAPYYAREGWYQTLYVRPYAYQPLHETLYHPHSLTLRLKGLRGEQRQTRQETKGVLSNAEAGALLIATPAKYLATLAPFVQWKRDKGLPVEIVLFGEEGTGYPKVQDSTALRAFLQKRYQQNDPPLKYLLLVGNREELPPLRRRGATKLADSDQAYGQLVGNDSRNEVYVGRFPAYTLEQLEVQVKRVLYYERDISAASTRLDYGLCISSNEGWGIGDNNETDYEHSEGLQRVLLQGGYKGVAFLFDQDNKKITAESVAKEVGRGVGVINYVGHGYRTRWTTSGYSVNDVYALTQTEALPVIFDVACSNGDMEVSPCFAEAWMWSQHGTKPSGAIGICASSDEQYWAPPMRAQDRMNDYFTKRSDHPYVVTLGGIMTAGIDDMLLRYHDEPGKEGRATAVTWNIFGDPSLVLRRKAPEPLQVIHAPEVYSSETSLRVRCDTEGMEAILRINYSSGEALYQKAVISGGEALFDGLRLTGCSGLHLTVWGVNKETYSAEIPCLEGVPSPVRIQELSLAPISVMQAGVVSAGDEWEVRCKISYAGTEIPYAGVNVGLTVTPSKGITLTDVTKELPPFVATGEVAYVVGRLKIGEEVENQTLLSLALQLRRGGELVASRSYTTKVFALDVKLSEPWSASTLTAAAGKSFEVEVLLENKGMLDFNGGTLRYYWEGAETQYVEKSLALLAHNAERSIVQRTTIPPPLAPFQEARLWVELRQGERLLARRALRVIGSLSLNPETLWQTTFPFSKQAEELTETLYYFGEPVLDGAYSRILGVRIPIFSKAKELRVRGLYADILTLAEQKKLSGAAIEVLGDRTRDTVLKIENNYITIPLAKSFDYVEGKTLELALRIQSVGMEETASYFLPTKRTNQTKTLVRRERLGKREETEHASLPPLRFSFADNVTFEFTVVDGEGSPVANAEIDLAGYVERTDAKGETPFRYLEGDYAATVFSPAHGTQHFNLRLRKENPDIRLVLQAPELSHITLVLMDKNEGRIPHGEVIYEGERYIANEEGEVELALLGGVRRVRVFAEGYQGGDVAIRVTDQLKQFTIYLSPRAPEAVFEVVCAPNPVSERLSVSSSSLMTQVRVYDVAGAVVAQAQWSGYGYEIDMRHLPRGVYVVEVRGDEAKKVARHRIVKDR